MHARRSFLKRFVVWTAVPVLLLTLYVAGAPIVLALADRHYQPALPFLDAFYSPLQLYVTHPEIPGSRTYNEYGLWCLNLFRDEMMIYDSVPIPAEPILP